MLNRYQLITATFCLCILATAAGQNLDKWSRQLEATGPGQADSFDWIPLAQPVDGSAVPTNKDRTANARVLTYSQTFPPNARFGNLPKAAHSSPSSQPQSFDFPYQFQRFSNAPQAQPLRQHSVKASSNNIQSQEPTSQSFFKFEMPFHSDSNRPASAPSHLQTGYQIQHSFGGGAQASLFNSALFNQNPVFPPEFHPLPQKPIQQPLQPKPLHQQNFIEDTFPIKNSFRESKPQPQAQETLQTVTPQVFPVDPQPEPIFELNKPSSFQSQLPFPQTPPSAAPAAAPVPAPSAPSVNSGAAPEEVQLLYVPYETLYNQQRPQGPSPTQNPSFEVNKYNFNPGLPSVNPYQINQFYTQEPLPPQDPTFYTTSTTNRPLTTTTNKPAAVFHNFASPQYSTPKPKPKAHQPPLAMFLLRNSARPTQSDVVSTLRNANTISVLDAPTKTTPEIFVGPAGMPIPSGYVKFDLPYLSQLSQTRELRDVPFFVAPLSYRTPNGFNKILLPEPHVGSIVINRAKDSSGQALQPQKNSVFLTPESNDFNQFPSSTQRTRPTAQHQYKQQQPTSPSDFYPDVLREVAHKNRNHYEATTQRIPSQQPSRGNKFNYFYDQDAIQEVTSPKIGKHDRPKKKRPQNVQIEQPSYIQSNKNSYAQFQPMPNQIANDDYYKLQTTRPATTSTSTTSTTTTTSSTTPAPTFYSFKTSPQVEFQSTNGQLYHDFTSAPKAPEEYVPRFTTRPPPVTAAEEEYQVKQYFRQQNAIRNRPQTIATTNPPFEQVQYTPVSLDYDRPVNIPVTTQKSTTHKQRVTFYAPTPAPTAPPEEQPINTIPPRTQTAEYNIEEASSTESSTEKNIPNNHRPSYNQNEILDSAVEYEPNPYQLPSELPPLAPNLPGLVNGLQEKDKQNALEQSSVATPAYEEPTRPTRRPINRIRKPVVTKVSQSVSYSESEVTSRRPSHRIRRPYGTRGSSSATDSYASDDESTSTTTRRPAVSRNPLIRNPNRIRYQPTPEERQTLRIKPKKKYNGSNKVSATEDLEYQRDVLKQNYPVFRPSGSSSSSSSSSSPRRPTSPTAIPSSYSSPITTTDRTTSETQQVYTVTPSNAIDNEQVFPAGLLEPMQIAQQYNDYSKDNYGPGYFPNQEDLNPTEPVLRNEINPVYTTLPTAPPTTTTTTRTTTTTTEEPVVTTTRRSPFIRRNYPRLRPTTTEAPITTTTPAEERQTARPRIPPRKVIKVRTRARRPQHPASSTTAPEDDAEQEQEVKTNYRKLNRFNQDLYENDTPRRRYKQQFHLDGQESQWSTANRNSFSPIDPKEERQENKHNFENEPEIVTAGSEQGANSADTYEVNISANLGSPSSGTRINIKQPNLKPEKSFAELLEEVMGKAPEEHTTESDVSTRTTDGTYFESQKTSTSSRLNRRGKWKKLKSTMAGANNAESFEMAESQNLGTQLFNSLRKENEKEKSNIEYESDVPITTTSMANINELTTMPPVTTTPTQQTTMDEYDMTTARVYESTTMPTTLPMDEILENFKTTTVSLPETTAEESATSRLGEDDLANEDDLETQPSLFSEVKRQLHELFAIEENEDEAATAALAAVGRRRHEYTNIKRPKPEPTTTVSPQNTEAATEVAADASEVKKSANKMNLMDHVVYATEKSTKVSSETEICYRGRCIRSEDLPPNHKLN